LDFNRITYNPILMYLTIITLCSYPLVELCGLILSLLTPLSFAVSGELSSELEQKIGNSLPEIQLPADYTASIFCMDVNGADGLALSSSGDLYAVSEADGCIYRINENGYKEIIAAGFRNPEGIAVSRSGMVYIVEDIEEGRLIGITPSGDMEVITEGLSFPEGVAVTEDGNVLITESSIESGLIFPVLSEVKILNSEGLCSVFSSLYLWSLSDIAVDSSGIVYVCNELSGYGFISASIIRIDPSDGSWSVFCRGLHACEGICFDADGAFPMYVVEEDTGEGSGRISIVDEDGAASVFAFGFQNLEDIVVDRSGRIYVSEDTSGRIILIHGDQ
ncbi:MAG: hypothetical protein KAW14_08380, partial [Candidatus Aegiribacteria sp.]|nr:hypothetical protein [Candidatus Aegiribacteria sp.]